MPETPEPMTDRETPETGWEWFASQMQERHGPLIERIRACTSVDSLNALIDAEPEIEQVAWFVRERRAILQNRALRPMCPLLTADSPG